MSDRIPPRPVTVDQAYWAAILAELRDIRKSLEKPQPAKLEDGVVDLKEPKRKETKSRKRGK